MGTSFLRSHICILKTLWPVVATTKSTPMQEVATASSTEASQHQTQHSRLSCALSGPVGVRLCLFYTADTIAFTVPRGFPHQLESHGLEAADTTTLSVCTTDGKRGIEHVCGEVFVGRGHRVM